LTQTLSLFGLPAAALAFFFPQRFESSAGVADLTKGLSLMRIVQQCFHVTPISSFCQPIVNVIKLFPFITDDEAQ
jgi:hypothetical protein